MVTWQLDHEESYHYIKPQVVHILSLKPTILAQCPFIVIVTAPVE